MNTLSDNVLAILFSWIRSFIQSIWNAVSSGSSTGFFTWLGDHWLLVAAALCLGCTVLDYLIWLIRWKPYVIWRQKIRSFFRRKNSLPLENDRRFDQGYRSGVGLDLQDLPQREQPLWDEPLVSRPESVPDKNSVYAPEIPDFRQIQNAAMEEESVFAPAAFPDSIRQSDPPQPPLPTWDQDGSSSRRRRSARHEKKRVLLAERLLNDEDEENELLDGLPPAVDRQSAFHEPVYPQSSAYTAWQQNQNRNMNG